MIVDTHGAWDTTIHIVDDLLTTRKPISVFVDNGQHSVVVSGVDATGDPLTNPNSITAIHVWDPGGGVNGIGIQPHMEQAVPINDLALRDHQLEWLELFQISLRRQRLSGRSRSIPIQR